jgi:hypothetical protein
MDDLVRTKVYHASGMKYNLTSVSQLTQKGYNVIFNGNECFIYDKPPSKMMIARVMIKNRMCPLAMNYDRRDASFAQKETRLDDF